MRRTQKKIGEGRGERGRGADTQNSIVNVGDVLSDCGGRVSCVSIVLSHDVQAYEINVYEYRNITRRAVYKRDEKKGKEKVVKYLQRRIPK